MKSQVKSLISNIRLHSKHGFKKGLDYILIPTIILVYIYNLVNKSDECITFRENALVSIFIAEV